MITPPPRKRLRIKHLARYFGILAVLIYAGYFFTDYSYFFLIFLGPCFFIAYGLRTYAGIVTQFIPSTPFFNNLLLILPVTLLYCGLLGYQIKNILNERGKFRFFILAIFLGFLTYIHFLAFRELSLYWQGSQPLTYTGPVWNRLLGNQ